jgi:hypothetical protein
MDAPPFKCRSGFRDRSANSAEETLTRPRAADDFAAIHARLAELRREREMAAKQDAKTDEPTGDGPRLPRSSESRLRPDKADLPGIGVGRRYLPARQR